jgi:hypothetical protein
MVMYILENRKKLTFKSIYASMFGNL